LRLEKKPMGSDMMVALGPATANRSTLFALNSHGPAHASRRLVLQPGGPHVPGEQVRAESITLPQARQTWTTLGYRPGAVWGYQHGQNEHGVAAGCATWQTLLPPDGPTLTGTDLVRLMLERAANARQAVDTLTDLVSRHGQGTPGEKDGTDHVFLVADPRQAFVVETAGRYWALQEIAQVRAAGDVGVIRQDWDRLAAGLADHAIGAGQWPCDGTKLDFAGAVSAAPTGQASALRRWGRATVLLEGQNGSIDPHFVRRLLADHYDATAYEVDPLAPVPGEPVPLCRHDAGAGRSATRVSVLAELTTGDNGARLVWYAFGPPCLSLYFPILLPHAATAGDLSAFLDGHAQDLWRLSDHLCRCLEGEADRWELVQEKISFLQARFEEETEEFCRDLPRWRAAGDDSLARQLRMFQQHHAEQFEDMVQALLRLSLAGAHRPAWH
jgi:dipeptidase